MHFRVELPFMFDNRPEFDGTQLSTILRGCTFHLSRYISICHHGESRIEDMTFITVIMPIENGIIDLSGDTDDEVGWICTCRFLNSSCGYVCEVVVHLCLHNVLYLVPLILTVELNNACNLSHITDACTYIRIAELNARTVITARQALSTRLQHTIQEGTDILVVIWT